MRQHRFRLYALFFLALFALNACEDSTTEPVAVDEAQLLVDYLEANRGYDVQSGFIISASDVRTNLLTAPDRQLVLDIRGASDYAAGHIPGAVNVAFAELPDYLASVSPAAASYEHIVIVCYSGQTAAFAVGVLRAMGYENAISMKWGMSGWHEDFASPWLNGRSNARATEFVTGASPAHEAAGSLPALSTGETDPAAILQARGEAVMAEGFNAAKISHATLFTDLDSYYVVNFWPSTLYETVGHIPGAVDYDPTATSFTTGADLETLPTDRPVVIYCYTGQTSAYLTGYLRVLGYDARSLLYGANGMIYDVMVSGQVPSAFVPASAIMNYDYET